MNSFAERPKDHVSLAAQEILQNLRKTRPRTGHAKAALSMLASWNGSMDVDRPEPLILTQRTVRSVQSGKLTDHSCHRAVGSYLQMKNRRENTRKTDGVR